MGGSLDPPFCYARFMHGWRTLPITVLLLTVSAAVQVSGPTEMSQIASLGSVNANAITVDAAGNIYLAGSTGGGFQATPHALKTQCDSPCYSDGFVAKLNPQGHTIFATYFGGSSNESIWAIAVDDHGQIHIAGTTWSADFPALRPVMPAIAAQQSFVATLSGDGRLLFSTTLGGNGARAVAVAPGGDLYVAGSARDASVPMVNAIQPVPASRTDTDAFLVRLRGDGSGIVFSTYLGGSRSDAPSAIAVTRQGGLVMVGQTSSADFPRVRDDRADFSGGLGDAFVTSFAADGSLIEFSRLLGGNQDDRATSVAVAIDRRILVAGSTESANFAVTDDALDADCGTDGRCNVINRRPSKGPAITEYMRDAFLMTFEPDGHRVFSTYIGGSGRDGAVSLALSSTGTVYLSSLSDSPDIAATRLCESHRQCPVVLYEISATDHRLIAETRLPTVSDFDSAPISTARNGAIVLAANYHTRAAILRGVQD